MIYVLKKERKQCNGVIERINNFLLNIIIPITTYNYEDHYVVILNDIKKRNIKKLLEYLKMNCTKNICIAENLKNKSEFISTLVQNDIYCFNGDWLFRYLLTNIIEYIVSNKHETLETQEVSILTNDINENILDTIENVSKKIKCLNIVTKNKNKFLKIEKSLYQEEGIILNINNNYEKSLRKSNIIVNYDFLEDDINKYNIYQKACIINVNKKIRINKKAFCGLYINSFNISIPPQYNKYNLDNNFNTAILYESLIYKNTASKNIRKEIKNDNVKIKYLVGQNGIIEKNEYLKI